MIIGVVGSSGERSIQDPLYSGATVIMDFERGIYRINGADIPVASMLSSVAQISAGRLNLVDGGAYAPIELSSDIASALDFNGAGFSLYIDFEQTNSATAGGLAAIIAGDIDTLDPALGGGWDIISYSQVYTEIWKAATSESASTSVDLSQGDGLRKVMGTVNSSTLAISYNGTLSSVESVAFSLPAVTVWHLGGYVTDSTQDIDAAVRKIIAYPFKDPSELNSYTI